MSTVINPDKSVVKKAKRLIRNEGAGFCPELLSMNIKYNCCAKNSKHACTEFELSNEIICPLGMYVKINDDKEKM